MTATDTFEITADVDDELATAAAGRFEPCAEHRGTHADGPCADCGWLAADHTAGLAEVIVVTRRIALTPLRRAS